MQRSRSDEATAELFDRGQDAWRQWQASPWGRLRYRVVRHTLDQVCADLGGGPLRVLDAGGGDGVDAIALAEWGHDVTIVDYSAPLLESARAAAEAAGVRSRVRTICADLDGIACLGDFDLVLCHLVLQYREDLAGTVATLVSAVADGGALSLIAPNPPAEVLAAAVRRQALPEALELLDAKTIHAATFDHEVRRIEAGEAEQLLAAAGFAVVRRYGIRCVTDFIADDARKSEPAFYAELERLELALCDREPFVRTARMWQLIAARQPR